MVPVSFKSSSISLFMEKRVAIPDSHDQWYCAKKFVYIACTFSTAIYNFDIFSKIVNKVRIFEFVVCEITIGMAYMFMDCFMKQYTRKLDAHKYLNPLLKGITYGLFMQTAIWALIHASYLADSLRFLVSSFKEVPSWSICNIISVNVSCVSTRDIILRCQDNQSTEMITTSAHFNYIKSYNYIDRNVVTLKCFVMGLVWIFNFFISTITDENLLKILKLAVVYRTFSTLVTLLLILLTTKNHAVTAFLHLLDLNTEHCYTASMEHVSYAYGIGFLGFYDFSNTSPYTMVDNAVILYMLLFTAIAFLRSWIMRVLYVMLTKCVSVQISVTQHYYLFAILPLSMEFMQSHKLYMFYIYLHVIVSTTAYLTMLTLTMSKLLQTEFRSVKNIYIIGLVCCLGFSFSLPVSMSMITSSRVTGLLTGLNVTVLYLGGFKVVIIMWVYGVQRFSTDIHFWLGFKPTKFWIVCWMLLPVALSCFLFTRLYMLAQITGDPPLTITATIWIITTVLVVAIIHIKTIAKYLVQNNLAAVFSSSNKYGPPDPEDRKKRLCFNETIHLRQCHHNCHILDDTFDCNHLPLMRNISNTSLEDEHTVKHIFENEGPSIRLRNSITLDIDSHQ